MSNAIAIESFSRAVQATLLVGLLALTSCAGMDDTQQKVLSGGVIGAVVGTVGVAVTGGCIPCGTAIGGAVGAGAAYLIDQLDKQTRSSPGGSSSSSNSNNNYNANSSSSYNTGSSPN